jgi:hypothetical protein
VYHQEFQTIGSIYQTKKHKADSRPVSGRRPRYAAIGETTCAGDGEGGNEPVEEPKEISGEVGDEVDRLWFIVSV